MKIRSTKRAAIAKCKRLRQIIARFYAEEEWIDPERDLHIYVWNKPRVGLTAIVAPKGKNK